MLPLRSLNLFARIAQDKDERGCRQDDGYYPEFARNIGEKIAKIVPEDHHRKDPDDASRGVYRHEFLEGNPHEPRRR